ncbi:MAG: 1-acyl-sn-glycerol-3-phosphate acyltransferase [Bacteroidales bacterium]|nr:1-acyl-sn-glycerol-3-phosphate acyltransferase [Bacteroidales bacterium]
MSVFVSRFVLKLFGWKVVKQNIKEKSYVIVAAPHTSNWDFIIARLGVSWVGIPQKVLMKKEMFFFPLNYILRALGAMPIDRKGSIKMVDYIIQLFKEKDDFVFSISPEGTRSYVEKWKTGFYHIATKANVPLVFGRLDYKKKVLEFSDTFYPTGNFEKDFIKILDHFSDAYGLYPEKFNRKPANITYSPTS